MNNYEALYTLKRGILFIVSGPSGAGKSLVTQEYVHNHPKTILSISETTREPRNGEKHGREYFFISQEEYDKKVKEGYYLEHAGNYGNFYGTPHAQIQENLEKGFNVILEIDPQGAKQVKEKIPDAVLIFILPESLELLEERLRSRKTETEEKILKRLSKTKSEIENIPIYNYVIINSYGKLNETVQNLNYIIQSERFNVKQILRKEEEK